MEEINDDEVIFRNYAGERYVYKQPQVPVTVGACGMPGDDSPDIVPITVAKKPVRKRASARRRKSVNE